MGETLRNWAGNVAYRARRLHAPATVEELQELVAGGRELRALGTGHSFSTLADTGGDLVSVARLPRQVELDERAGTVAVGAGLRYGELVGDLHAAGFALHNLGSLPHISVAGACATGTHGSGAGLGGLATAVREVELVAADGKLTRLARGDEDFAGAVVALGALGVVTRLTLGLVPAFDVQQWVYEELPHRAVEERFDEVMTAAYSVSLFTDWRGEHVDQVWLKHRVGPEGPLAGLPALPGATPATGPRHPVPGQPPGFCTEQGGAPGPWHARLPHFRLEFTPSSGEELQSEYFVARADAPAAFAALHRISARIAPALQVCELRTVAADDLWLSMAHGRHSAAFHFTWLPDVTAVASAVEAVEEALRPFAARPHWGKVFAQPPREVGELYERHADFQRLAARLDPEGKFRNEFVAAHFPR